MQTTENDFVTGVVIVGGGKMGGQYARKLAENDYDVAVFDISEEAREEAAEDGLETVRSLNEAIELFDDEQVVLMLSLAHEIVGSWLEQSLPQIPQGSIIIDGGNTDPRETEKHTAMVADAGSTLVNAGISGGVLGYESGFTLLLGGDKTAWEFLMPAMNALHAPHGAIFYDSDAKNITGHLLKTLHNGFLYALLQCIAKKINEFRIAHPEVNLADAIREIIAGPAGHVYDIAQGQLEGRISASEADEWNTPQDPILREFHDAVYTATMNAVQDMTSVIKASARGVDVAEALNVIKRGVAGRVLEIFQAVLTNNPNLEGTDGRVDANGTGRWAYEIAQEYGVATPALREALEAREASQDGTVSWVTKLIALARGYFGSHPVHPEKVS